jgi:hypothetical protein
MSPRFSRNSLRALMSRSWWMQPLSLRRFSVFLFGIFVLVAMLAVPSKVSVDGIFYITGARSLFGPDFADLYPLFREPGYPLFLRVIHEFSSASLLVVGAQAALLAFAGFASVYSLNRALGRESISRFQALLALILLLNPVYITYAGHFMQQSFFAGILGGFLVLVEWARRRPTGMKAWHVALMLALLSFVAIWTSIGWLYLAVFPTSLALSYLLLPSVRRLKAPKSGLAFARLWKPSVTLVAVLLIAGTTYVANRVIYGGWEVVRDAQIATSSMPTEVLKPLTGLPGVADPLTVFHRYGVLMGIGVSGDYPKENDQFLNDQMRLRFPFSEWDTAYVNEPFTSYAPGYFTLDHPSFLAHTVYSLGSFPVALPVYSAVFVLGNLIMLLAAIRRKWVVVGLMLVPISFIAIHALSGTPIDRYGIPTYATFAASVALVADWGFRWITNRPQRRQLNLGVKIP